MLKPSVWFVLLTFHFTFFFITIMRLFFISLSGLVVLSVLAGCSSNAGHLGGLYPCEGTVTYKGVPVAGASVTFHPDGGDARPAGGETDADGKFKTTTLKPQDGIFPGTYKVTIAKYEEYGPPPKMVMNDDGEMVSEGRPVRTVLPEKYAKPESSGLTVTIGNKKATENFDLTD